MATGAVSAAQRCDDRYPRSAPTARYADNGDGTVTDRVSGLMWMRCSAGQSWSGRTCTGTPTPHDHAAALSAAARVNAGADHFFSDWRLPELRELATIAERQCNSPRVNLDVFPATPALSYWTATTRPGADPKASAFALGFGSDGVAAASPRDAKLVRLVRDGR